MPVVLSARDAGFADSLAGVLEAKRDSIADINTTVANILAQVRQRGDEAVLDYTRAFDRLPELSVETMRLSRDDINGAADQVTADLLAALRQAAERIRLYHARQRPQGYDYVDDAGVRLGCRWSAVEAAGLYVPGGTAAYPSSVLMNAIPAKVAGVERLVMVVPTPDGVINPLVMAAAREAGIDEVYRIGGAQAVGALAYGTDSIRPVDKIVGPGNAWVAAAKRQVFGTVGIDMIAGPSEILVVADAANDPVWIAADLLSQAEHDTAAQSILITDDGAFATAVEAAVENQLKDLPRAEIARISWESNGAIIIVETLDDAPAIIDHVAPEHLELAVADADSLAARVRHAGAIFLGRFTPEAVGDYVGGPNHVLPTARSARFSSGLGVVDFMKRTSLLGCSAKALEAIGPTAVSLAEAEGLHAHGMSVALRLQKPPGLPGKPAFTSGHS